MSKLMNEFQARDHIIERAKQAETLEQVMAIVKNVQENFNYDYGVAPRAIGAAAYAVASFLARKMGITGFQAGFAMFDFIRAFNYPSNKCGLRIIDYDDMLYPQYEYKFQKTISLSTWQSIQVEAKKRLDESKSNVHPAIIAHWKSIANGVVPFGYCVEE